MTFQVKQYGLLPGDEIIVPKSGFNIVQHHALYLGSGNDGIDWMVENHCSEGVRRITAKKFFSINPTINKINKFLDNNNERKQVVKSALQKVGTPYHLINYNCKHFTNHIRSGMAESKQVQTIKLIAVIIAIIIIVCGASNYINPKKPRYA